MRAHPWSGSKKPVSIFIVVDLPAPFGPRKPSTSPRETLSEISSTAVIGPKVFFRRSASTSTSMENLPDRARMLDSASSGYDAAGATTQGRASSPGRTWSAVACIRRSRYAQTLALSSYECQRCLLRRLSRIALVRARQPRSPPAKGRTAQAHTGANRCSSAHRRRSRPRYVQCWARPSSPDGRGQPR